GTGIIAGATSATPIINQGGNFNLVVTNTTNGCTSTDNVAIATDFAQPQANAGPGFQLTCVQNTYTMVATASSGPNFVYSWTTNTGNFTSATNILTPTVNGSGSYFLLVTDNNNGCTQNSTVQITQAADVPVAFAANAPVLTCAVTSINLSGTGSSTGAEFTYNWVATLGGNITNNATTLSPTVNAPGLYTLSVINTTNNCVSNSSVTVSQDIAPPTMDAGLSPTLTCANPNVQLLGSVSTNGSFTYNWQAQGGGNVVSGGATLTPTVNAGGTYVLVVTSQQNGCTNTDNVLVNVDQTAPNVLIVNPAKLTCAVNKITIDASGSSTGNMSYTWTTTGGNIVDQSNPLAPTANKPGVYNLLIKNNDNGCTQTAATTVIQDIINPIAKAGTDGLLTCAVTSLQLDGSGSSATGSYFYQWSTVTGQILVGANTLTPTIVAGGTYQLFVKNNDN
ncbi:MAG: hypothetical protein EBZ77_15845, partial [Chitinophagia bacterium]|nr:hypothetical protein [Chitinophagia bacterium]